MPTALSPTTRTVACAAPRGHGHPRGLQLHHSLLWLFAASMLVLLTYLTHLGLIIADSIAWQLRDMGVAWHLDHDEYRMMWLRFVPFDIKLLRKRLSVM